jgi:hypothetical protein
VKERAACSQTKRDWIAIWISQMLQPPRMP